METRKWISYCTKIQSEVFISLRLKKTFFKESLFIFREGKGGRKRGRETSVGCLLHAPNWDLVHNPVMCLDWELNL